MSNIIQLLPNYITNQIASGEVIQRPASVVKELLENSLDAEAKSIKLILQDAGKSLIKVIDDGKGMSITDASMSFLRYATSKIKTADDLSKIRTMGFRGEALASIAAVCQVEMKTRRVEDEIGISLFIEGSKLKEKFFIQTSKGTSVTVKNIFYNVPSRRKFLKSNQEELRKIMDEFNRLILAYPNVRFILYIKINNKLKKYLDFPPVSLSDRILGVFGKKIDEEMISINEQENVINLKGYIVKPSYSTKSLKEQFIFVNNRFIKNSYISKTVLNAFKGFLPYGSHPSYFLFFFLDPKFIDVNIHPTKNEIIFENENFIYKILYNSIKRILSPYNIKTFTSNLKLEANYNPLFSTNNGEGLSTKNLYDHIKKSQFINKINLCNNAIFQLHKKYIISYFNSELIIIDQHRAHKRIYYEFFLYKKNYISQQLRFPISLFFSKLKLKLIKNIKNFLISMGFSISFNEDRLIVEAAPIEMNKQQINDFFNTFLIYLSEEKVNFQELFASSISSSIAIKHGVSLSINDMNHIIYELFSFCKEHNYTPSGKRIFITLNNNLIKKQFNEL
jgi:DNA mismatch repair protein MutL